QSRHPVDRGLLIRHQLWNDTDSLIFRRPHQTVLELRAIVDHALREALHPLVSGVAQRQLAELSLHCPAVFRLRDEHAIAPRQLQSLLARSLGQVPGRPGRPLCVTQGPISGGFGLSARRARWSSAPRRGRIRTFYESLAKKP